MPRDVLTLQHLRIHRPEWLAEAHVTLHFDAWAAILLGKVGRANKAGKLCLFEKAQRTRNEQLSFQWLLRMELIYEAPTDDDRYSCIGLTRLGACVVFGESIG